MSAIRRTIEKLSDEGLGIFKDSKREILVPYTCLLYTSPSPRD
jgi:hypothetical protein